MESIKTDICILGGGSGGLVISAAAAFFGVKTLYDSKERFESLGVKVLMGGSKFIDPDHVVFNNELSINAKHFVIATGSSPVIPEVQGLKDVPFLTNETIFNLKEKVDHLIVMGGGPVGCELAQAYRFLGAEITIIQRSDILSKDDRDYVDELKNIFSKQGIKIYENSLIESVAKKDSGIEVTFQQNNKQQVVNASHLLVAVGRQPNIDGLSLDKADIQYDKAGIVVNKRLRTANKRIYAIGDVINGPKFTHIASYQAGIVLQNILFKRHKTVDHRALPWVTYTTPQLAHIGLTEKQANDIKGEKRIVVKKFQDNDRAQAESKTQGGIKIIATKQGQVLGVSILGHNIDNLIGFWSLVITQRLSLSKVIELIIPYPTRGEINKAAAVEFYRPLLSSKWLKGLVRFLQWF